MNQSSHISPSPIVPPTGLNPPLAATLTAAAAAVTAVIAGSTPDSVLQGLAPKLRAGAMDLSYTALRDYGRGDFLLARLTAKRLPDDLVHSLLLVAISRLERRPEEAHTVVNQATDAAKEMSNGRYKGVVNGVLRNFLRQRDELLAAANKDAVAFSRHPAWWINRIRVDHPASWKEILAAGNSHPPMCLRLSRRRLGAPRNGPPAMQSTSTNWQSVIGAV